MAWRAITSCARNFLPPLSLTFHPPSLFPLFQNPECGLSPSSGGFFRDFHLGVSEPERTQVSKVP